MNLRDQAIVAENVALAFERAAELVANVRRGGVSLERCEEELRRYALGNQKAADDMRKKVEEQS